MTAEKIERITRKITELEKHCSDGSLACELCHDIRSLLAELEASRKVVEIDRLFGIMGKDNHIWYTCPGCQKPHDVDGKANFCPSCGARIIWR